MEGEASLERQALKNKKIAKSSCPRSYNQYLI